MDSVGAYLCGLLACILISTLILFSFIDVFSHELYHNVSLPTMLAIERKNNLVLCNHASGADDVAKKMRGKEQLLETAQESASAYDSNP